MKTKRNLITVIFALTALFIFHSVSIAQQDLAANAADEEAVAFAEDAAENADLAAEEEAALAEDASAAGDENVVQEKVYVFKNFILKLFKKSSGKLSLQLLAPKRKPLPEPKPFPCCM
jgi:hypothetical protein